MKTKTRSGKLTVLTVLLLVPTLTVCAIILPSQNTLALNIATKQYGLTLSPLRRELEIAPGTSQVGELTVTDSTDKPMVVEFSAEEFSVINQKYDYAFNAISDVAKWATFNPSLVNLKAGESIKVKYTVGVPLAAEPGGRYISLFASTNVGSSESGVNSQERVGSLLYITVLGDVLGASSQIGHLVSLSSPWLVTDKSDWSMALQNVDSTHFRSNYSVTVENLFGGVSANMSGSALIMPGTIRAVTDALPLPQFPGIYKITYNIGLGNNQNTVETRYMLYVPLFVLITILVVAVVVVLALWRRLSQKRH